MLITPFDRAIAITKSDRYPDLDVFVIIDIHTTICNKSVLFQQSEQVCIECAREI